MARAAAGDRPDDLLPRLRAHTPGKLVNATIWTILALRQAGEPAPPALVRAAPRRAAAVGRLVVAGRRRGRHERHGRRDPGAPLGRRARAGRSTAASPSSAAIRTADGGFELTHGRGSDTQSTAWAIQALLAAGASPGPPAFRYLQRMRRPNGSYRYNARYVTTPLWVTAQVLPALARKPFPLATG